MRRDWPPVAVKTSKKRRKVAVVAGASLFD